MSTIKQASEVATEVEARMQQITTANAYLTEIGSKVFRGRRRIDDSHVPCIVIAEGDDQPRQNARLTTCQIEQHYILIAYDKCDADHPNDKAHQIIKDLKKAIFNDGTNFGNKVIQVSYTGRDIGPRSDGVGIVCASIEITVKFTEDLANA